MENEISNDEISGHIRKNLACGIAEVNMAGAVLYAALVFKDAIPKICEAIKQCGNHPEGR